MSSPEEGRRTLGLVMAATTLVLVAYTTTVSSVNATAADFDAGLAWQTWVLSGMSLGLAAALLTIGALADLYGHRRVFVWSSVALAGSSALGALAPSVLVVVVARVAQGAAGAGMLAAGLGLLGDAFPGGAERTRATALWGAALAAGIATGPVLAAGLTDVTDWRAAYWLAAGAALALAVLGRGLPAALDREQDARVDLPGAVAMVTAMTALTAGITSGRTSWTSPATVVLLAVGVVALAGFIAVERRRRAPMLDLGLFRRPRFLASIAGASVTGLGTISIMTYVPIFLERNAGITALAGGIVLVLWSGTSMVAATQVRRIPERIDSRTRLATGLAITAVGVGLLVVAGAGSEWWAVAPGLAVAGVGSGVVNAALGRLAVESVPPGSGGLGSGANNTARYFGSALGIALMVAVITGAGALADGWQHAVLLGAAFNLVGAGLALATRAPAPA